MSSRSPCATRRRRSSCPSTSAAPSGAARARDAQTPTLTEGHIATGDKGLKAGALGYMSNLVIGVASTAPAYSLAATLGFIVAVAGVGVHAPAVLIVSFVPILFVALAYRYLNKADPDCGHDVRLDDARVGPVHRLDERLGDLRRGRDRDGVALVDRRAVHVPAVRLGHGGELDDRADHRLRSSGSRS